ncbi:TPA: DUF4236 domain-containing protein [Klebsiella pneumoniae]|uniref:DUF4236 domain-containing protein n=1 Tax=Klebsiella pneumoniae TaxID=573 RepID=UPI00094968BB|nr:DUF4236 domain-containing protein [Klebsiella pneumoniae]MBX4517533.1 DUF4236 domain-containing protein [Klebsiella pneumoniae]MDK7826335.1 DUF4236 domain-containing protein [Klebsiella pneumoniae]MDT4383137.1 DUF4236 domain-containing protein [Klebsiella pneumoniae]OVV21872.1 hypothetical protein BME84_13715 [Klebsiella pneumoniae]STU87764.1 Uncharacterised protein [Klebsiella pneumoniae]
MGFRFRKRIRIAKGVYINIGKKGVSASVQGKGFSFTTGKNGPRASAGIPGTGLSFSGRPRLISVRRLIIALIVLYLIICVTL